MAETEMSIDSLDSSLIYLKISDNTLENLASSLVRASEDDSEECCGEQEDSGCGRSGGEGGGRGTPNTSPGFSRKSSPDHPTEDDPHKHTLKYMQPDDNNNNNNNNSNSNNDVNKMWSASMQDLSHTVESILATGCCVGENWRSPDISYMGVPAALGEMLLQHGEFPATPAFTPTPRYRSTPLETTQPGNLGESSSVGGCRHNDAFAASTACSHGHHKYTVAQSMGELTYGVSGGGDRRWAPFSRSLMMTTPENLFTDETPRLNLGQQQMSPASLPSGISWRIGDGEGPWTSLSSCSSSSSSSSSSTKHYTSPTEGNTYPRPQFSDPSHRTMRSAPLPARYQEWQPEVMPAHPPYATTTAAYHHTSAPAALPHAPHQPHAHHQHYATHDIPSMGKEVAGAPAKVSPRRTLIQDVVLRESIRAFRSHPLFPLLKDLALADYYFDKASFSVVPLLSFLPTSAEELVWQYRRRHQYGSHGSTHTSAVDAVIMDAIIYAHTSLLEKVSSQAARITASVESEVAEMEVVVEEMCQRYVGAVRSSTPLHILQTLGTEGPSTVSGSNGKDKERVRDPQQQLEHLLASFSPIPPSFDCSSASPDSADTSAPESRRRSHSYHRKVTEVLTAWLTEHRENPYPDDDQKVLLMQRTGFADHQINQWFTSARCHLLPKLRADVAKE